MLVYKRNLLGLILAGIGILAGCSLDDTSEFSCGTEGDDSLFENPPPDTAFVKIESIDSVFTRVFIGVRKADPGVDPVEGVYENLMIYERPPDNSLERLYGLGTQILDPSDSSLFIMTFNLSTGSQLDEICRSGKVFQKEHDWSKWNENIAGVEILIRTLIDDEWLTFSSDTSQEDEDLLLIDGAEFLDNVGIYARLSGSFNVTLQEVESEDENPREAEVNGAFILNMRVSR